MERVLVTGGAGYVGTTVVPTLLEAGYAVRVADRFFFGRDLLRDPRGDKGDLRAFDAGTINISGQPPETVFSPKANNESDTQGDE